MTKLEAPTVDAKALLAAIQAGAEVDERIDDASHRAVKVGILAYLTALSEQPAPDHAGLVEWLEYRHKVKVQEAKEADPGHPKGNALKEAARYREAIAALSRAPEPVAVPVGWYLVPEVPTESQMQAGLYQSSHDATYEDVCQTYMDMVRTPLDAPALATPPAPQQGDSPAADGFVLVPREPTEAMLDATNWSDACSADVWRAMIAASSAASQGGAE